MISKDTFMEKVSLENDFGFVVDFANTKIKNKLYQYMVKLDREKLARGCNAFMEKVQKENKTFSEALNRIKSQ